MSTGPQDASSPATHCRDSHDVPTQPVAYAREWALRQMRWQRVLDELSRQYSEEAGTLMPEPGEEAPPGTASMTRHRQPHRRRTRS